MNIVVIGGTGLIGSKLAAKLGEHGHEAVSASPDTGVDTLTGEGLSEVLAGSRVVVDVKQTDGGRIPASRLDRIGADRAT